MTQRRSACRHTAICSLLVIATLPTLCPAGWGGACTEAGVVRFRAAQYQMSLDDLYKQSMTRLHSPSSRMMRSQCTCRG